jgi:hypothetical protein
MLANFLGIVDGEMEGLSSLKSSARLAFSLDI